MRMNVDPQLIAERELPQRIAAQGFAFVRAADMRCALQECGSLDDWSTFAASWDELPIDLHMADGGRYRRRRHAVFEVMGGRIARAADRPHYQTLEYNRLNGGVARQFEPMRPDIGASQSLTTILRCAARLFGGLAPEVRHWDVELHQFRIEARPGEIGKPTPEGMHRDGVDFVLVLLVRRENIASGTTSIHGLDGRELGSFTLAQPLDAALVEDARVYHGVTPVEALDPAAPAFRDVLVITFRRVD